MTIDNDRRGLAPTLAFTQGCLHRSPRRHGYHRCTCCNVRHDDGNVKVSLNNFVMDIASLAIQGLSKNTRAVIKSARLIKSGTRTTGWSSICAGSRVIIWIKAQKKCFVYHFNYFGSLAVCNLVKSYIIKYYSDTLRNKLENIILPRNALWFFSSFLAIWIVLSLNIVLFSVIRQIWAGI